MRKLTHTQRPSPNRRRLGAWFAVALVGAAALAHSPAHSQIQAQSQKDATGKLQDVQRRIQSQKDESAKQQARAEQLKAELDQVSAELVRAARRAQDQEVQVVELEAELTRLVREADAKTGQLRDRRQQFAGVVMALSRIARFPTEALIAQPIGPEDTVRSAILLRAAVPAIEVRAHTLRTELDELGHGRDQVEVRRLALKDALQRLRDDEARIEAIRKQKAALRAEALSKSRAAQSEARKLAGEASSLVDLVERLNKAHQRAEAARAAEREAKARRDAEAAAEAAQKAPAPAQAEPQAAPSEMSQEPRNPEEVAMLGGIGSISKARGQLPFPVVGKMVGAYGEPLDGGMTRKGLSIETRLGAQVISPFDGQVVFAGPFRGYGQLLIIDHGEGYHSLLAGLGRIDTDIGQPVLAGEPIARMAEQVDGASGEAPVLYVEFRRDNRPINPLPWLASRKGTPQG